MMLKTRFSIPVIIFYISNFLLCILIAYRLKNKTSSPDLKQKVLSRHFKFFAIFSIFVIYSNMTLFEEKIKDLIRHRRSETNEFNDNELDDIYSLVNLTIFNIPAVPIALLRLMEPYVFQEV